MARTIDEGRHAERRQSFLNCAAKLLASKGYENVTISDVLDETGCSKGAFYHYFSSKQDLFKELIDQRWGQSIARLRREFGGVRGSAVEKLRCFLMLLQELKAEDRPFAVATMDVWLSNKALLDKSRTKFSETAATLITAIVHQGINEGTFSVRHPDQLGRVLIGIMLSASDECLQLLRDGGCSSETMGRMERMLAAHEEAIERILSIPEGSLVLIEQDQLRQWFITMNNEAVQTARDDQRTAHGEKQWQGAVV